MVTHDAEERRTVVARECGAATSAVIVTGYAATVLTPDAYRRDLHTHAGNGLLLGAMDKGRPGASR